MRGLLGVRAVHAAAHDAFPLALELGELGFVCGELGAELEAFGFFLGNESEKVGVSISTVGIHTLVNFQGQESP